MLTKEGLNKPYDNPNSFGKTYGEHRKALELSEDDYRELKGYADKKKIIFSASVWDEDSADFIASLNVPFFKIGSPDLTNIPLLGHIAKKGKPILLSTGMSNMEEIEEALKHIKRYNGQIILLHCVSTYPSEFEEINLNVINTLKERFDLPVGYSGHEKGIAISLAAVALGACVIERHFTLDRTMKGGDHAASLEPVGFVKLVRDIRNFEKAKGSNEKKLLKSEIPIREKLAKSLVSKVNIKKGTVITQKMLTAKSPGTGLAPKYCYIVPGKKAKRDIKEDAILKNEDIEW